MLNHFEIKEKLGCLGVTAAHVVVLESNLSIGAYSYSIWSVEPPIIKKKNYDDALAN